MNHTQIIYLAGLLMDMSVAGTIFAVSRRAAELGASAAELGWLGGTWIGVYALGALVTGRFSDRVGRRTIARIGCGIAAVMVLMCAFVKDVHALLVLTAIFGAGLSCFWPAVIAWLSEGASDSATLNVRLSRFNMAWNLGLLLGFGLTGLIFKHWPALAFMVSAGAIVIVIGLLSVRSNVAASVSDAPAEAAGTAAATPIPVGRGFRKTAWVANFALCFVGGGTSALFPQLATSLGIGADVHGGMLAVGRGAALVAFAVLQHLMFWRTRVWPLWIAQVFAVTGLLGIALAGAQWLFVLAFALVGAVSGYTYQASIFFTLEELTEKGKGSGFHEAVIGAGMFAGPSLAGWVGQRGSLRAPYFFCAAMLVAFILAQMLIVQWRRRQA